MSGSKYIEGLLRQPGFSAPGRSLLRQRAEELRRAESSFEGAREEFERQDGCWIGPSPRPEYGPFRTNAVLRALLGGYDGHEAKEVRYCRGCYGWFAPSRENQWHCDATCRKRASRKKRRERQERRTARVAIPA